MPTRSAMWRRDGAGSPGSAPRAACRRRRRSPQSPLLIGEAVRPVEGGVVRLVRLPRYLLRRRLQDPPGARHVVAALRFGDAPLVLGLRQQLADERRPHLVGLEGEARLRLTDV